jgi:hypothetical protein
MALMGQFWPTRDSRGWVIRPEAQNCWVHPVEVRIGHAERMRDSEYFCQEVELDQSILRGDWKF